MRQLGVRLPAAKYERGHTLVTIIFIFEYLLNYRKTTGKFDTW
ncbi:hypothetical protein FHU41_001292 [Psychromicrobium silvestre]|uniref:Uncharacterized protein n=1 Tax=Psychromicrobium silvestre TaxID=1645614 RepID=A0A7Y9LT30_9MICC|nr:hypothetical protein [Psychromicrobium silvestre]